MPGHEKPCLIQYVNNNGADQTMHPGSQFSTFVVRYLDSIACIHVLAKT